MPNGQQSRITLHLENIKRITGLTAPPLSLIALAVIEPNICYNQSLVHLLISNPTNELRLHQFLLTKTIEMNKSLKNDANGAH